MLSGHEMLGQLLVVLLQSTSHLHEFAQSMLGHAAVPLQVMSHALAPQLIPWHESPPPQVMSHPLPSAQSMLPHAFALLHWIVQRKPTGHLTSPHGLFALHSIWQVLSVRSQDEHGLGHGSSTQ
ncbi:MAG TPA: hypothetical protein VHN14_34100 [Kofleriaceae bacterium]|nr:hypothetical protein [Kofleriaceae bacterium]